MRRTREELLRSLAGDLAPAARLAPPGRAALGWLAASAGFVAFATLASGPLRPGALEELVREPGFALDVALGAAAAVLGGAGLARLRVPGPLRGRSGALPALLLLAAWAALQGIALLGADEPASTLGARALCWLQVLVFSLPPLGAALWLARRAAPLERAWTGLAAGLAAGALSALAMQLACMHAPAHALLAHLAPILLVAAAGAVLARLLLRPV